MKTGRFFTAATLWVMLYSISFGYSGGSGTGVNPYKIANKADLLALAATTADYDKCFILTADIDLGGQIFTRAIIAPNISTGSYFRGSTFEGTFDGNGHKITNFTINGGNNGYLGFFGYTDNDSKIRNLGIENYIVSGSSSSFRLGGLAGANYGSISQCYSNGAVSGSESVGGLVGWNRGGSINRCYSTAHVSGDYNIGGLVGNNEASINQSYSNGPVSGSSGVGGLVGYGFDFNIGDSFWDIQTSGQTTSIGGTGKTTVQMQDINTFLNSGWDFVGEKTNGTCNYWIVSDDVGYPKLAIFFGILHTLGGSGTEAAPYIITDANDLGMVCYRPSAYYVLADSIDLTGIQWNIAVVPEFNGVLDGRSFCIHNLFITGRKCLGLFGQIGSSGSVKNLGIENYTVRGFPSYYYMSDMGGLAGENYGSISQCYAIGIVNGSSRIGGLVGYNRGVITSCYVMGTISGDYYIGGLVGENEGSISQCYSTGTVSGISSSSDFLGGLVGYGSSNVKSSFWDTQSSGRMHSAGGTGKTAAEMKTQATFTGIGWVAGVAENGLYFDGISGYVKMPEYYGIGGAGARTVSMWIKPMAIGRDQVLIQWGADATGQLWVLRLHPDGTVRVGVKGGGIQSSKPITYNQWHHIIAMLPEGQSDSNQICLYIDGKSQAVATTDHCTINTSQTVPVHLGALYNSSTGGLSNYFYGLMDDVCIYDRALDGSEIAPVYYATGLVNHWKLDEGSGLTAQDSAGSQNGELHNMAVNGWVAGKTGNALALGGVSDYVEVQGYKGIVGTQSRTCCAWIKTTAVQQGNIVSWGAEQNGQRWSFRTESNGTLAVGVYGGQIYTTATVNDGQWHHVAAVLNNDGSPSVDEILLYIDGVLQGTTANSTQSIETIAWQEVILGAFKNSGVPATYFNGLLDDVCIYDRALESSEIASGTIVTDGLVALWEMDEFEGNSVSDSAGDYDGTIYGMEGGGRSSGRVGKALIFDGKDDYVEAPGYKGILGTQSRTCSAWIKTTSTQQGIILNWGTEQDGQKWQFRVEANGTLAVGVGGGYIYAWTTVNDGQWHYVAAVLDDDGSPSVNKILLYVDGFVRNTTATSTQAIDTVALYDVMMGACKNAGTNAGYFNGQIDDVCIYNRALEGSEIAPIYYAAGLMNHWKLDEAQGATAGDSAGSQNGILQNMTDASRVHGRTGNALSFDGLNDHIEVTGHKGITGTASRSCSAWIKTNTVQQGSILSWGAEEQNGQRWVFRVESNGTLAVGVGGGYACTTTTVNNGQWRHVAAVLKDDGSPSVNEILLYVDGLLQGTTANTTQLIETIASQDVMIGAYRVAGVPSMFFYGLIDEVCIYNRAIEIDEIYPDNKFPVSTQGLVAHWRMDETEGAILHDDISSHNGTLNSLGWDFSPSRVDGDPQDWIIPVIGTDYPKLRWQIPSLYHGGLGTADDPFRIADVNDILLLSDSWCDWDKHFILIADIDMGGMIFQNAIIAMNTGTSDNFLPWGTNALNGTTFKGTFDGNGYTISNFTINGNNKSYLGLFGYVGIDGQIKNLGLENCTIDDTYVYIRGIPGPYYMGTLAGFNAGTISQCYTKGTVSGYYNVGGLVGGNGGEISNCYNTGSVTGYYNTGGLAGSNSSSNRKWPDVNAAVGNILMCYSTGTVSGQSNVGGLVGYHYQSTLPLPRPLPLPLPTYTGVILNSFWDIQASGLTASAGGTGKTTAQMKTQVTFTGVDWVAGVLGNALSLDGVNSYVDVPGYKGITGITSRTCCAWIKTTAVQQGNIVSWGAEQNGQRWSFRTESDGTLAVGVYGGQIYTTATVNDGQWHHVAAVLNSDGSPSVNEILLYIDGVLQGTTANSTQSIETIAWQEVILGAFKNSGVPAMYFKGLLDEVCIYGRALDASEIDLQGPVPAEGLIAHWAMDETKGFIAHDTVSSYDGILKSAGWDFVGETINGTADIWFIREGLEYPRFVWEDIIPVADAGQDVSVHCAPNGFAAGQLDGSGSSDADNDPLTYHWNWAIDEQEFTAEGAAPTIQLPLGIHEITLIVSDGILDSEPNTVMVTVYNTAPVANAGVDITAYLGFGGNTVDVTMDGSGSNDTDGDALTYKWCLDGTLLSEEVNPTVSLSAGEYAITLIVNDGIIDSEADEVIVAVIGPVWAKMRITPSVFILKSQEKFVWAILDLPSGITPSQLDRNFGYFILPGEVKAKWFWHIGGENPKVIARFERDQLRPYLHTGRMELTFYGRLKDGRYIGGRDKIWVINPPDKKNGK